MVLEEADLNSGRRSRYGLSVSAEGPLLTVPGGNRASSGIGTTGTTLYRSRLGMGFRNGLSGTIVYGRSPPGLREFVCC